MKKQLLITVLSIAAFATKAQSVVTDTVVMGAGYANQVWYSLADDEKGVQAKNNWDIAFRASGGMSSDIMVNHSGGGTIWAYPKANKSGWASVDTTGLSLWIPQYNMETAWNGALGRYADAANPYDLGWGIYDMGSHNVNGDSIYIVKTQTGNFKKLTIDKLASGTYTFTYANLDGSGSTTSTLAKSAYSTKNYGYFNLDTKTAIDREPAAEEWDLVFGQYSTGDYASMGIAGYTVTGVLVNDTLKIAKAVVDPTTRATFNAYGPLTFSDNINGLGYNWKSTSGVIKDSNVYFVRTNNGNIWKLNFTGWISGATGNGSVIFTKQLLTAVSIKETMKSNTTIGLSPNPAVNGQNINIVYNFDANVNSAIAQIYDMTGRVVMTQQLETSKGLHAQILNSGNLNSGIYIISVVADNQATQQRLIVQ